MGLFNIKNNKLEIDPTHLAIPVFREIWERDTTPNKTKATTELSYITFLTDYKSPYRNISEEQRQKKLKSDFFKDPAYEIDVTIKLAIKEYQEFQYTPMMGLIDDAMFGINQLRVYYRSVDFNEVDNKGNLKYKPEGFAASVEKLSKMISSLEGLKERVEKEMNITETRIRGGGTVGRREG